MASQWFYEIAGKQGGPVTSAELLALAQRGTVIYDTPVRKGPDGKWVSAKCVRGLFPATNATSPSTPTVTSEPSQDQPADALPQKPSQPLASDVYIVSATPPSEEPSQCTAIGNIDAICPYCGNRLEKKPGRKKKCPHCGNFIHVRTRPLDNQKVLATEKQTEAINEQWATVNPKCILIEVNPPAVRPSATKAAFTQAAPMIQESSTSVQESVRDVILQTPEEITRYVVSRFARVSEKTIADLSLEILRVQPHSPEIHLLYALRVSKCIPTLKAVSTLASRWSIANRGPQGNSGLQNGRQSSDWELVNRFLTNLYLQRFHELCEEVASKADETAAKRKTPTAKESAYQRAINKILEGAAEFVDDLPGLHETKTRWIDRLKSLGGSRSDRLSCPNLKSF